MFGLVMAAIAEKWKVANKESEPSVPWGRAQGHVSMQDTIPRTASHRREAVGRSEKKEGEDDSQRGRIVRPHMCPPNRCGAPAEVLGHVVQLPN